MKPSFPWCNKINQRREEWYEQTGKDRKSIAKGKDTDLIKLLGDKDQEVRIAAIDGLGQIGKEDSCNVLITLLDDESPKVRGAVARALGMLGDDHTATHLNYQNERETDEEVRKELHEALGKIKSQGR